MPHTFLSSKAIPVRERLIMALDVPSIPDAQALVEKLDDSVIFYKVGMELFMSGDYFGFIEWLKQHGKKVFVDLKFFDVPETVGRAGRCPTSAWPFHRPSSVRSRGRPARRDDRCRVPSCRARC